VETLDFHGSWWLPGKPKRQVAGTLTFDDHGLRLVLYGELEEPVVRTGPVTPEFVRHSYPILHGLRHSDSKHVTLLNVVGDVLDLPFPTFSEATFNAEVALVRTHLDIALFSKISFEFDYLLPWAQPPSRRQYNPEQRDVLCLQTETMVLATSTLADKSVLTLRSGLHGTEGDSTVELYEFCAFDVVPPEPTSWEQLVDYVSQYRDLLTLSLGRAVRVKWVSLADADDEIPSYAYYPLDEPIGEDAVPLKTMRNGVLNYQMPTLLTAKEAADSPIPLPLDQLFSRWFSLSETVADTLPLVLGCFSASAMLPEHRYSSLFSGAEELHKALDLGDRELPRDEHRQRVARVVVAFEDNAVELAPEDRAWALSVIGGSRNDKSLREKVLDLLGLAGPLGDRLLAAAPNFPRNVSRSRGKVSHSTAGSEKHRFVRLCYELLLRWIVRVVIISELLDPDDRLSFQRAAAERRSFLMVLERLDSAEAEAEALRKTTELTAAKAEEKPHRVVSAPPPPSA
jgi:hypothetical protein